MVAGAACKMTKMQDDAASGDQSLAQCWNVGPS